MRLALVTQRVAVIESYQERRDCLDQGWADFLGRCGFVPCPVMNRVEVAAELIGRLSPELIVLTGGNDLVSYGGQAPERDQVETELLKLAIAGRIPVLGVCRGMQLIHAFFGGRLVEVAEHVALRHQISMQGTSRTVNSYHNWGINHPPPEFNVDARALDGTVEGMQHSIYPVQGIMWHPEREKKTEDADIFLVAQLLKRAGNMKGEWKCR